MWIYLVLMLSQDCGQYVYGAYPTASQACSAMLRCQLLEKVWQYEAALAAERSAQTVVAYPYGLFGPQVTLGSSKPLNFCIVQRAKLGEDDLVDDVPCPYGLETN